MIDPALAKILAAGAYVAIFPVGAWLARRAVPTLAMAPMRDRIAAALAVGVGAWSMLYILLALTQTFQPPWSGALGWIAALLAGWRWRRDGALKERVLRPLATRWHAIATMVAFLLLCVLYLGFPHESLLGSRDEGLYTLMALALERTGSLAV